MSSSKPVYDIDFYSDEVIQNPYPVYQSLRDIGPAVWIPGQEFWALPRYKTVRFALENPQIFSSAHGCTFNDVANKAAQGTLLNSDDPVHRELRTIFAAPLFPAALNVLKERFERLASSLIAELKSRASFEVVTDLSRVLPLTVVTELVGLNEQGRQNMLDWAAGLFNAFGTLPNVRTEAGLDVVRQVVEYVHDEQTIRDLTPGGLGHRLFEFVEQGKISRVAAETLLMDYLAPALDTTISATSSLIWKLGTNRDQWALLKNDSSLIRGAINEAVRVESPLRAFARFTLIDCELDGVEIPAGSRVAVMYGSANRDERKWENPEKYQIRRKNDDHVGFGRGVHMCAGMHLARMEMSCILQALIEQVENIEVGRPEHIMHNTIRAIGKMHCTLN